MDRHVNDTEEKSHLNGYTNKLHEARISTLLVVLHAIMLNLPKKLGGSLNTVPAISS